MQGACICRLNSTNGLIAQCEGFGGLKVQEIHATPTTPLLLLVV